MAQVTIVEAIIRLRDEMTTKLKAAGSALLPLSIGMTALGGGALKAASDFESAFAGVRKTFSGTEEDLQMVNAAIRKMATQIPATTTELAAVAEAAGQLGIKGGANVLAFTETMVRLGVSTNLTAEEAAVGFARFQNITLSGKETVGQLGSALVFLGNNFATTEREILEMSIRLAKAGEVAGLSRTEIMGISAALSSVGIEAEAGGSAASRILINMQVEARKGGAVFAEMAKTAGETTEAFQKMVLNSPAQALQEMAAGLNKVNKSAGDVFGLLEELGITDQRERDAALGLATAHEMLGDAMTGAGKAAKENTALLTESGQRFVTLESILKTTWSAVKDVGIEIGQGLLPQVKTLAVAVRDQLVPALQGAATLFKYSDPIVRNTALAIGAFVVAIPSALIALGTLGASAGPIVIGFGLMKKAFAGVTLALGAWYAMSILVAAGLVYVVFKVAESNAIIAESLAKTAAAAEQTTKTIGANWKTDQTAAFYRRGLNEAMSDGVPISYGLRKGINALNATTVSSIALKVQLDEVERKNAGTKASLTKLTDEQSAALRALINETRNLGLENEPVHIQAIELSKQKLAANLAEAKGTKILEAAAYALAKAERAAATEQGWKKIHEDIAEADKEAQKLLVSMINLNKEQEKIAMATGMASLDKMLGNAAKNADLLYTKQLPIEVVMMEQVNALKQQEVLRKEELAALDRIKAKYPQMAKFVEEIKKGLEKTTKETFDWGKALQAVTNFMEILGINAESAFGKAIAGITATLALTQETSKLMKDADGNKVKFFDLDNAKQGQVAQAGLNAAMIAYKSGALGGAAAGAIFGAQFGPWGIAIGGAVGGLLGFFGASKRAREEQARLAEQLRKTRDEYIRAAGGIETLRARAEAAGASLFAMLNASTVQAYQQAIEDLNRVLGLHDEGWELLNAAMNKYGIGVEQLGPKFAQQKLNEQVSELIQNYEILTRAGVDQTVVLEKMSKDINEYVKNSLIAGTTVPESMRPILAKLIELGLLTDENGDKMEDLSRVNFTESMEAGVARLIDKIGELIDAMLGIPNVNRTVTVTTRSGPKRGEEEEETYGDGLPLATPLAAGYSGWVTQPRTFLVGEKGPEFLQVTPKNEMPTNPHGAGSGTPQSPPAQPQAAAPEQTFLISINLPGGEVLKYVEKASKRGMVRIHPNSVKVF